MVQGSVVRHRTQQHAASGVDCNLGRVFGITRRGFGASTHPPSGYDDQRLADDVLRVIEALRIANPILVGHSMAGGELTTVATRHSERLAGLVYLDAGADPKDLPIDDPAMRALYDKLPASMRGQQQPSAEESHTFQGYRDFQTRTIGFAFPESEPHNIFETNLDGTRGRYRTPGNIFNDIGKGQKARNDSRIRVPILAFFAGEPPVHAPANAEERAAIDAYQTMKTRFIGRWKEEMRLAGAGVRIVDLPDASHFVFSSHEADVLREMRAFVEGL